MKACFLNIEFTHQSKVCYYLKQIVLKLEKIYFRCQNLYILSDFIWPFLPPYMGVIPNQKMTFIFPISCILVLIFPIFMIYLAKCEGKGSFPKSQIKSLILDQKRNAAYKTYIVYGGLSRTLKSLANDLSQFER